MSRAMLRVVLAVLLTAACYAAVAWHAEPGVWLAMPPLLAAVATAVISSSAALSAITFLGLNLTQWVFITTLVYGAVQQRKAEKRARAAYNNSLTDRYSPVMSASEAPWQIVYGEAPVGACQVAAQLTSGDRDQFKYVVYVWAAHECEAITDTLIAGVSVGPLDANGDVQPGSKWFKMNNSPITDTRTPNGSGVVTVSRNVSGVLSVTLTTGTGDNAESATMNPAAVSFSGNTITVNPSYLTGLWAGAALQFTYAASNDGTPMLRVRHHLGTATQAADAMLLADCPGEWTATDQLKGLCYSVFRYSLDEPEFQGGPPQATVRLKGKKLYDHRTGTTMWTDNAAVCMADFVMGEYGKNATSGQMGWDSWDAAANVSDEALASQGGAKRYTVNGAFRTDTDPDTTLNQLAQAMAGFATFDGTWQAQAGAYTAPVMDIGDADNWGPVEVIADQAGDDVFNGLKGRFFDPARFDQLTDYTPFSIAGYVTADNGPIWGDLDLPFTAQHWRAHNLARIQIERSRGMQLVFPGKMRLLKLRPGQRVRLSCSVLSISLQVFRVVKREYRIGQPVMVTLQQDSSTYYDEATAPAPLASPSVSLTDPFVVAAPLGATVASGDGTTLLSTDGTVLSRTRLTVPASADALVTVNGVLEIEYRLTTDSTWTRHAPASGSATTVQLEGLLDDRAYTLRIRWVNGIGAFSAWVPLAVQTQGTVTNAGVAAAQSQAAAAQSTANAAQVAATAAQSLLTTMRSNGYIDAAEKPALIREWNYIAGEYTPLTTQATAYSITTEKTAYDNAYNALGSYLSALTPGWADTTTDTPITPATDAAKWSDYYNARGTLTKRIAEEAGKRAVWAQVQGSAAVDASIATAQTPANTAQSAAATAQGAATAAQASADAANAAIADSAADGKLSPVEKQRDKIHYDALVAEKTGIDAEADRYGITTEKAAYGSAHSTLVSSVGPLLADLTTTSTITGSAYRAWFTDVLATRQALLNKIAAAAKGLADSAIDLVLLTLGNVTIQGSTVLKSAGGGAWNGGVVTAQGSTSGAAVSWVCNQTTATMVVGLATTTASSADYALIEYGIYCDGTGGLRTSLSGTVSGVLTTYAAGDVLSVEHDRHRARFFKNGAAFAELVSTPTGSLYGRASMYTQNGSIRALRFGSMSAVRDIGTEQLAGGAATEVYSVTPVSAVTITGVSGVPDGFAGLKNTVVATVTFTAPITGYANLYLDGEIQYTEGSGTLGRARWSIQQDGGTWDGWKTVASDVPPSSTDMRIPLQSTRRFAVTAGVSYSFSAYACKYKSGDTMTVSNHEMRAEIIKR